MLGASRPGSRCHLCPPRAPRVFCPPRFFAEQIPGAERWSGCCSEEDTDGRGMLLPCSILPPSLSPATSPVVV